jgi:glycosyltransferase involved in cell wall biosynthesis
MTRLAIFTSHPIQYQAPWFRALAGFSELTVRVFFSYIPSEEEQGVGFGQAFKWDIPLTDGYDSSVLSHAKFPASVPPYLRKMTTGIHAALRGFRPDIALILGWHHISLVQAIFSCRFLGVPIILRGESNDLRKRRWLVRVLHRVLLNQCAGFLAIGASNVRFYLDAGVSIEKIVVAPYFVENERFRSEAHRLQARKAKIRSEWGIPEEAVCFAFIGKMEPKKRVMDFIDAIKLASDKCDNIHGLVVGTGEMLRSAKSKAISQNSPISFAGFLNQTEITRAYVAADAVILPSDYGETWGLVVNEAMATGLPAIVSDRVGCANDLVLHEETGSVFPFGDVSALAGLMQEYAGDSALRRTLGERAQRRVLSEFSIDRAVDRTLEATRRFRKLDRMSASGV